MHAEQSGPNGALPRVSARPVAAGSELDRLRATCRRQALVIDTLSKAVSTLRGGAAALRAENADLRVAHGRADGGDARAGARVRDPVDAGEALDVPLPLDPRAPAAARIIVAALLRDHVPASVLGDAQLVASELVTNSVRHSRAPATSVAIVTVQLTGAKVRLEVADGGRDGVIAARPPDLERGGGMGLHMVQALSECWGFERAAASGTRVWAQLAMAPRLALASGEGATAPTARDGRRTSLRIAPRRPRRSAEGTL